MNPIIVGYENEGLVAVCIVIQNLSRYLNCFKISNKNDTITS